MVVSLQFGVITSITGKMSHCKSLNEFLKIRHLDQIEDDNGGAKPLQHLVKMEGSYVGVRICLVHCKKKEKENKLKKERKERNMSE